MKRALLFFREETGQSPVVWLGVALLNFIAQIIFRRELKPGEFGTLNTALGMIGMMTVPLLAVHQAFAWYLAREHPADQRGRIEALRAASLLITETFGWVWGGLSFVLLVAILPLLDLPRFSLDLFVLLTLFVTLGALVSAAVCRARDTLRVWAALLLIAAFARVLLAAVITPREHWAESGLAAFFVAGFITLAPMLRQPATETAARIKALRTALDPDFLVYLGATFSVLLAIFLFSSADRIVAQSWFGTPTDTNMGFIDWAAFDAYHTAGLLGRALLWGTQPLLLLLFVQRSRLNRTTAKSLFWFWIYLGVLLLGWLLMVLLREPLSWIFCGSNYALTARLVPLFATAMVPLGLLQALAMFALASRRYHECFALGGASVGFTLMLYLTGRQPQLMTAYMFGGGLVILMAILFVGVARWGRKQP